MYLSRLLPCGHCFRRDVHGDIMNFPAARWSFSFLVFRDIQDLRLFLGCRDLFFAFWLPCVAGWVSTSRECLYSSISLSLGSFIQFIRLALATLWLWKSHLLFFYFGSLILLYLLTDVERLETVTGSRFFQSFTHSTTQTKPCPTINTVIAFQQPHQGLR